MLIIRHTVPFHSSKSFFDEPSIVRSAYRDTRQRAFSLIELLVTIGVIGVLISIILPAIAGARRSAREAGTLSNLRQTATAFELYTTTYANAYPWAPVGAKFDTSPDGDSGSSITPGYWDTSVYWPSLMHRVAPWREWFRSWVGPGGVGAGEDPWNRAGIGNGTPSYLLSKNFFARPEVWKPGTALVDSVFRPVFVRDVTFPSSKVMLLDNELTHLRGIPNANRDRRPMLFADSHAAAKLLSEATKPWAPPEIGTAQPVMDTPDGVRGRDY